MNHSNVESILQHGKSYDEADLKVQVAEEVTPVHQTTSLLRKVQDSTGIILAFADPADQIHPQVGKRHSHFLLERGTILQIGGIVCCVILGTNTFRCVWVKQAEVLIPNWVCT